MGRRVTVPSSVPCRSAVLAYRRMEMVLRKGGKAAIERKQTHAHSYADEQQKARHKILKSVISNLNTVAEAMDSVLLEPSS